MANLSMSVPKELFHAHKSSAACSNARTDVGADAHRGIHVVSSFWTCFPVNFDHDRPGANGFRIFRLLGSLFGEAQCQSFYAIPRVAFLPPPSSHSRGIQQDGAARRPEGLPAVPSALPLRLEKPPPANNILVWWSSRAGAGDRNQQSQRLESRDRCSQRCKAQRYGFMGLDYGSQEQRPRTSATGQISRQGLIERIEERAFGPKN
jgi:hypothetical protein